MVGSATLSQLTLPAVISLNDFFLGHQVTAFKLEDVSDQLRLAAAQLGTISKGNANLIAQWRSLDALTCLLRRPQLGNRQVSQDIIIRGIEVALRGADLLFQNLRDPQLVQEDIKSLQQKYDGTALLPIALYQNCVASKGIEIGRGESARAYELTNHPKNTPELVLKVFEPGHEMKVWCDLAMAPKVYDMGMLSGGAYYVIVPRLGGDLHGKIGDLKRLSEKDFLKEVLKITNACAVVQARGIISGDLRAPNILSTLDGNGYEVIDYGQSVFRGSASTREVYHPSLHYKDELSRELRTGEAEEAWKARHKSNIFTLDESVDVLYLGTTLLELCLDRDVTFDLLKQFHRNPSDCTFNAVPNCLKSVLWVATQSSPGLRYKNLGIMKSRMQAAIQSVTRDSTASSISL